RFDCDWSSDVCSSDLAPAIALLTLPWLALSSLSSSGSALNTTAAQSPGEFIERCAQAFIECTSVTPLIGSVIILLIAALLARAKDRKSTRLNSSHSQI